MSTASYQRNSVASKLPKRFLYEGMVCVSPASCLNPPCISRPLRGSSPTVRFRGTPQSLDALAASCLRRLPLPGEKWGAGHGRFLAFAMYLYTSFPFSTRWISVNKIPIRQMVNFLLCAILQPHTPDAERIENHARKPYSPSRRPKRAT